MVHHMIVMEHPCGRLSRFHSSLLETGFIILRRSKAAIIRSYILSDQLLLVLHLVSLRSGIWGL